MEFKVGVFSKGKSSNEIVNDAKKVLHELAIKHNCSFEFSVKSPDIKKSVNKIKSNINNTKGKTFLSFGGEIDLD